MRNKIIPFFIALFFSATIYAQPDTLKAEHYVSYYNQFVAGGLFGKKGTGSTLTISTTHGVRYKRASVGLGLGYDSYLDWRTLPVFTGISYDLATTRSHNALFIQLNAGYNRIWNPSVNDNSVTIRKERGRFISPAIGYRIHAAVWSLYIMAGYKFQRIKNEVTYPWWGNQSPVYYIRQDMERITVQIGFGLH
jgi:hypothetical protein